MSYKLITEQVSKGTIFFSFWLSPSNIHKQLTKFLCLLSPRVFLNLSFKISTTNRESRANIPPKSPVRTSLRPIKRDISPTRRNDNEELNEVEVERDDFSIFLISRSNNASKNRPKRSRRRRNISL